MTNPKILLPVIVTILMTPVLMAGAVTLPDAFDVPCMGGMGIIADICIAVNLLNDEQVAQDVRITDNENVITILSAIQILEQIEQNTLENQAVIFEAQLASLPDSLVIKNKLDNNGSPCLGAGGGIQPDWCAGQGTLHNVQDVTVTVDSFVVVSFPPSCNVQASPTAGAFIILCGSTFDGQTLRYIVMN